MVYKQESTRNITNNGTDHVHDRGRKKVNLDTFAQERNPTVRYEDFGAFFWPNKRVLRQFATR